MAGLWHDLGKYQPSFQSYIRSASRMEAHIEVAGRVKHAIAGAIHAVESLGAYGQLIAYLIVGHHAGLPDWDAAESGAAALGPQSDSLADRVSLAAAIGGGAPDHILRPAISLPRPPIRQSGELHLWLRMPFSALVDADFLDTESFMDGERSGLRGGYADVGALCEAYDRHMTERLTAVDTPVKRLRAEIRMRPATWPGGD